MKALPKPTDIGWVYFVEMDRTQLTKVGFATDVEQRLANLRTASPFELHMVDKFRASRIEETRLHKLLKLHLFRREWYRGHSVIGDLIEELAERRFLSLAGGPFRGVYDFAEAEEMADCRQIIQDVCEAGLEAFQ